MADSPNRKRGRPKKTQAPVVNEESVKVTMTERERQQMKNGVGDVHASAQVSISSLDDEKVTLAQIKQRWHNVFSKYGQLNFDTIMSAWGSSNNMCLRNPFVQNQRVKQISTQAMKTDKDSLSNALSNPPQHEQTLRSVSMQLYYTNFIYQNLVQLNRHTPMYNYYYQPLYVEDGDKKKIKEDSERIDKALKKFNPKLKFKTIATQVYQEGKCSYLVRLSYDKDKVNYFTTQKLNSDEVKITGFGVDQEFIVDFNMIIFLKAGYSVEQYPPFIQEAWRIMTTSGIVVQDKKGKLKLNPKAQLPSGHMLEMIADGSYMYWVRLPQDICYTFYSDGSHANAFPDTVGMFNDLNDLDDYRWLQGNLLSKGVNSILTAEVATTRDAKAGSDATIISPDTILGYSDFFAENISANILGFFAPFTDFKLHTLENQPESMDIIYSRIRDLIATSGNSALLPITDKPSIASVKAAEAVQASKNDYLTKQFQSFLNNVINNNFDLKCDWQITLWGDIFYWRDDAKMMREFVNTGGMTGLLPRLLSANDQTLEDYKGSIIYLDALDIELDTVENLREQILQQTQKEVGIKVSAPTEKNPVGRPKLSDTDIDNDNTGTSADAGNNVSEIKMSLNTRYSNNLNNNTLPSYHYCVNCNRELNEFEKYLCDECLEEAYQQRN